MCPRNATVQDRGAGKRKAGALCGGRGKVQGAPGLTINQIVAPGGPERIPQMGDFFVAQMGDVFAKVLCFDTGLARGMGGRRFGDLPLYEGQRELALRPRVCDNGTALQHQACSSLSKLLRKS